jgi:hypothetical protein
MWVQLGEMSRQGWLINYLLDVWANSSYFLYVVFGSICKAFASFQHILWPSLYAYFAIWFFKQTLCQVIFVPLIVYFYKCACFANVMCHSHMGYCTHTASSAGHLWPIQFSSVSHRDLVGTGPVRDTQQTKQCMYNIQRDCGICHICETSRPL